MTVQEANGSEPSQQQISFFVDSRIWDAIREKAEREQRSASFVARRALEREAARKR